MADRIPTYIDTATQQITEIAVGDGIDVTGGTVKADNIEVTGGTVKADNIDATGGIVKADDIEVTNLTIDGTAYEPFDPTDVSTLKADDIEVTNLTIDGTAYEPFDPTDVSILKSDFVRAKTFVEHADYVRYNNNDAIADLELANNFIMNFGSSGTYNFVIDGVFNGAGDTCGFTLTLQTTGMTAITWDRNIVWPDNVAPALEADTTYVFAFLSTNGTTFKGFVGGKGFV
jgi:hypothetical protein